jgi:hypothetical protein
MLGAVLHFPARNRDVVLNRAHGQMLLTLYTKYLTFVVTCDGYFPSHSSVGMVRSNYKFNDKLLLTVIL